jgi:DNA-binding response OmpR family regulator
VLRYLVEERRERKPWVIVMTANLAGAAEAERAPVTARVLPKPFDIRELVRHVRDCVDRELSA